MAKSFLFPIQFVSVKHSFFVCLFVCLFCCCCFCFVLLLLPVKYGSMTNCTHARTHTQTPHPFLAATNWHCALKTGCTLAAAALSLWHRPSVIVGCSPHSVPLLLNTLKFTVYDCTPTDTKVNTKRRTRNGFARGF